MAEDEQRRREQRASEILPEEQRGGGSADPEAQATAVQADSDQREEHSRDEGAPVEHRASDGTDLPA